MTAKKLDDHEALEDAAAMQAATLEALERMQLDLAGTELVGHEVQEHLRNQQEQTLRIQQEADRLQSGLGKSNQLFNKLGRLGLRFRTEKKARNEVKKVYNLDCNPTAKARKKDSTKNTAEAGSKSAKDESKHSMKRPKNLRRTKKSSKQETQHNPKSLLQEMGDIQKNEHRDQLQSLADTDQEIDRHLEQIDSQLDSILTMSRSVHDQVQTQSRHVEEIHRQIDDVDREQKVVNHRARRFLDGKLRKQYDVQDTIRSTGRKIVMK